MSTELKKDIFGRYIQPTPTDITGYEDIISAIISGFADSILSSYSTDEALALFNDRKNGMRFIVAFVNENLPEGCGKVNAALIKDIVESVYSAKLAELSEV